MTRERRVTAQPPANRDLVGQQDSLECQDKRDQAEPKDNVDHEYVP